MQSCGCYYIPSTGTSDYLESYSAASVSTQCRPVILFIRVDLFEKINVAVMRFNGVINFLHRSPRDVKRQSADRHSTSSSPYARAPSSSSSVSQENKFFTLPGRGG